MPIPVGSGAAEGDRGGRSLAFSGSRSAQLGQGASRRRPTSLSPVRAGVSRARLDASGRGDLLVGGPARRGVSPGKAPAANVPSVSACARWPPAKLDPQREPERPPTRPLGCGGRVTRNPHSRRRALQRLAVSQPGPSQRGASSPLAVSQSLRRGLSRRAGRLTAKQSFGPLGFHRRGRLVLVPA